LGVCAIADTSQGEKRLFNWQNQATLTLDGRPLGECRVSLPLSSCPLGKDGPKKHAEENMVLKKIMFFLCLVFVSMAGKSMAANISAVEGSICNIRLSGVVELGDDTELLQLVSRFSESESLILCLDSPGGSLSSALNIARFLWERGVGTYVEENATCESSCSIIFFMGTLIQGDEKSIGRGIAPGSRVGIHNPSLSVNPNAEFPGSAVTQAFELALQAAGAITALGQNIDGRTGNNWIPLDVVNHLLNTPHSEMYVIDQVGEAQEWNIDIPILSWPSVMNIEFAWNTCNFSVRERMGWRHSEPTISLQAFITASGQRPVALVQRFMRGQRNPQIFEQYQVHSAYELNELRFACVLEYYYPASGAGAVEIAACVVPYPSQQIDWSVSCDNRNDIISIQSALAGFRPEVSVTLAIDDFNRMASSGLPSRLSNLE
jgi:hypothetical protein